MSLFGSLMRDMEQDPIFGAHQRAMNRMMSSFFPTAPVPPLMGRGHGMRHPQDQQQLVHHQPYGHDDLMPFGGGGMMNPFGFGGFPDMSMSPLNMMFNMDPSNGHGGHAFSSSSFVSISSGPDGRPQVYQASAESRQGPDGLRETRKTLSDSRTGTKKMAVGRHLGEKAHVVEREQNVRTGQLNENHEFINLEEQEAPHFDREWRQRATHGMGGRYAHSSSMPAIASAPHASLGAPHQPSYIEQPSEEEPEETKSYSPAAGYQPQHSQSAVTIEELPASDDEAEQLQQQSRAASRRSYPQATASSAAATSPAPSSSRRSPYGTSKEKRLKRSRLGKKF